MEILNGSGSVLDLDESPYQRAGLPPPPTQPIALSANRALPQAIVELDWTWCGTPTGPMQFTIQFPVAVAGTATVPTASVTALGIRAGRSAPTREGDPFWPWTPCDGAGQP